MDATQATPLREGLAPLPARMRGLLIDERGYPVPYFVMTKDGKPDHRVADRRKLGHCIAFALCWVCGERLGKFKTFCIGPMCAVNRVTSEPPSHLECARYSAHNCPFLTRPKAHRRDANMPDDVGEPAGTMLKRNPGVVCLWTCRDYQTFIADERGRLFRLDDPIGVEWYAEGRKATRAEIMESIDSGYPLLEEMASAQSEAAVRALEAMRAVALKLVPA